MEQDEFKKILFQAAFYVMACDGEIHNDEISELQDLTENSIYFSGIDHDKELSYLIDQFKTHGSKAITIFFDSLKKSDISSIQKEHMLNVLIRIIKADNRIDDNEVVFLHNIRNIFQISDNEIIIKFPQDIKILTKKYDEKIIESTKLSDMSFSSIEQVSFSKE